MPLHAIVPATKAGQITPAIGRALTKWKGKVISDMARYPVQQAGVTYKRRGGSGGYAAHWKFALKPGDMLVYNNAEHAVYLGGPTKGPKGERAAVWARAYGWIALDAVGRKHLKDLNKELGIVLRQAVRFTKV